MLTRSLELGRTRSRESPLLSSALRGYFAPYPFIECQSMYFSVSSSARPGPEKSIAIDFSAHSSCFPRSDEIAGFISVDGTRLVPARMANPLREAFQILPETYASNVRTILNVIGWALHERVFSLGRRWSDCTCGATVAKHQGNPSASRLCRRLALSVRCRHISR